MSQNYSEDIIFILSRDDLLACAKELGIPKEQVTNDVIELSKKKVGLEFSNWPEILKSALMEAIKCPLGLVCYPSCYW